MFLFIITIIFFLLVVICTLLVLLKKEMKKTFSQEIAFNSLWKVQSVLLSTLKFEDVVQQITNVILKDINYINMGYVIVVLALVDKDQKNLRRIGISRTEEAEEFIKRYPKPFTDIEIPLDEIKNIGVQAIRKNKILVTSNVADVLYPTVDADFVRNLQQKVGLKTTIVFPVVSRNRKLGILIFSLKKDQSKISDIEWAVMRNYAGSVGIAVENSVLFEDVSKSNEALTDANKKLEDLDKLKDDFVSIASHELRTPMTAIRSYAWMALNKADTPLSSKMQKYLQRTLISTERLINLVNDMLNISRIESGRVAISPISFDMVTLVKDVLVEVEPKSKEKQLNLLITGPILIPKVFADPDKVREVLLNLIGNAMKFTLNGGSISMSFFTDGQMVETSVKDSGVGISKEDLSKLFLKFGRLDDSYVAAATSGGTGLGLYICKSLITLMRGKIWASSEGLGKGTTFTFSLPAATPQVLANEENYTIRVSSGEAKNLEPVAI